MKRDIQVANGSGVNKRLFLAASYEIDWSNRHEANKPICCKWRKLLQFSELEIHPISYWLKQSASDLSLITLFQHLEYAFIASFPCLEYNNSGCDFYYFYITPFHEIPHIVISRPSLT
jgi:hypothetical protein